MNCPLVTSVGIRATITLHCSGPPQAPGIYYAWSDKKV
ncbi:MAG: hypothetical protein AVDCRST_MAG93-6121 [uncultured Chloroflexia bacterium]|uniref:Uncharacterized protein n=1 Tax=uncultured Chloroflexia bacterium TaxID=1672391 RepID=A0A6J4LE80_9CHLR|nr:MAG: hypothetical protein AVDCRST_MAG93-6121 [uncultured Chloroflexia bacterium]